MPPDARGRFQGHRSTAPTPGGRRDQPPSPRGEPSPPPTRLAAGAAGDRSLVGLFMMLASAAVVALGDAPDPLTGQRQSDLVQAGGRHRAAGPATREDRGQPVGRGDANSRRADLRSTDSVRPRHEAVLDDDRPVSIVIASTVVGQRPAEQTSRPGPAGREASPPAAAGGRRQRAPRPVAGDGVGASLDSRHVRAEPKPDRPL